MATQLGDVRGSPEMKTRLRGLRHGSGTSALEIGFHSTSLVGEPFVVDQGEPAEGRAAAVWEAGRRSADELHPLRVAAREAEGVVADRCQSVGISIAGEDPWAERGRGRGGSSSPVGADLVDVEEIGVGG